MKDTNTKENHANGPLKRRNEGKSSKLLGVYGRKGFARDCGHIYIISLNGELKSNKGKTMADDNKYEKIPKPMLPQVQQQVTDRIAALEKVIETQRATMEEALSGIKEQLEEAKGDLDYINQRME